MRFLSERGFVGSIGDDLPSLIPLTFALLVFFAALGYAFNQFDYKQSQFDQKLLLLKIGSTLKGDSLIGDYAQFENACKTINISGFQFRAGIYDMRGTATDNYKSVRLFEDSPTMVDYAQPLELPAAMGGKKFECPNSSTESLYFRQLSSQQPEVLFYPVAVNIDGDIQSGMLAVVVWR